MLQHWPTDKLHVLFFFSERVSEVVIPLTRIWVGMGSNVEQDIGYPFVFSSVLLGKCRDTTQVKVKVKVTLRLTVSQSVCLGVGHPFGAHDQILLLPFFLSENCFSLLLGRPL
jgi:hypothetical protein